MSKLLKLNTRYVFFITAFLLLLRPAFDSELALRLGEFISLALSFLFVLSYNPNINKDTLYVMLVTLVIALSSVLSNANNNAASGLLDVSRFIIPFVVFYGGVALGRKKSDTLKDASHLISVLLVVYAILVSIQYFNIFGPEFDNIYNVNNLVMFNKSAGFFSNHIEPSWLAILILSLSYIYFRSYAKRSFVYFLLVIFCNSKASFIISSLCSLLVTSKANINRLFVIGIIMIPFLVFGFLEIQYFSTTVQRIIAGDIESDPSTYLRLLDYQYVFGSLLEGKYLILGNGALDATGDSYMGTSFLMYIFRYGLIATVLYYFMSYKLVALSGVQKPIVIIMIMVLFDLIANGSEALKGLIFFYFVLGYVSNEQTSNYSK